MDFFSKNYIACPFRTYTMCFVEDLAACAALDSYPVIPIFQDRQITKLGPDRER